MVSWITFHQKDVREDPAGFRMMEETIDMGGGGGGGGGRGGRGRYDFMQQIPFARLLPPSWIIKCTKIQQYFSGDSCC